MFELIVDFSNVLPNFFVCDESPFFQDIVHRINEILPNLASTSLEHVIPFLVLN